MIHLPNRLLTCCQSRASHQNSELRITCGTSHLEQISKSFLRVLFNQLNHSLGRTMMAATVRYNLYTDCHDAEQGNPHLA